MLFDRSSRVSRTHIELDNLASLAQSLPKWDFISKSDFMLVELSNLSETWYLSYTMYNEATKINSKVELHEIAI